MGNLENVGWAKRGYEGLYNVYVMDETHTVLGCGGRRQQDQGAGRGTARPCLTLSFPMNTFPALRKCFKAKEEAAGYLGRYFSGQPAETEAGCPSAT